MLGRVLYTRPDASPRLPFQERWFKVGFARIRGLRLLYFHLPVQYRFVCDSHVFAGCVRRRLPRKLEWLYDSHVFAGCVSKTKQFFKAI